MNTTSNTTLYQIKNEADITKIVLASSALAKEIGFTSGKQNIIATIVSELGKNILYHAGKGCITLSLIANGNNKGIEILAKDEGPGIANIEKVIQEHYDTNDGSSLGLPAVKRMTDELEIKTKPGKGTSIIARKWLNYDKH